MAFSLSTHHHLPLSLYSDKNVISSSFAVHTPVSLILLNFNQKSRRPTTIISAKPKKVDCIVKLALQAEKATPAPPVGTCLGPKIKNLMEFCKAYNARTAGKAGSVIPVEVTVYADKSFTFILKSPPASYLLLKAAGVEKGSKDPKMKKVGKITIDQLRKIAQEKLPDLNCTNIDLAMRTIAGTAANMGIDVDPPILEPKQKVDL